MTYITKYITNLESLKKELEEYPDNIKIYAKYEGFNGDSDAIDYLTKKLEEYIKNKKSS